MVAKLELTEAKQAGRNPSYDIPCLQQACSEHIRRGYSECRIVGRGGAIVDSVLRLENRRTGETLRMRRERDVSGQVILINEGLLPPGSNGPPPHVHFQQREEGRVQAGTLGARMGGKTLVVQTGGEAAFPAGVVHSWWNAGETFLEFGGWAGCPETCNGASLSEAAIAQG